jgi:hypothetical protein
VKDFYNENCETLKKTLENGRTSHGHGLVEFILWKWLYYYKKSTDSMQLHKISNFILHRNIKKSPKIHLEAIRTLNRQSNPEQKDQRWKYHSIWLQIILQSHGNQNSIVLEKKTYSKPME